jgi:hypothetical protein
VTAKRMAPGAAGRPAALAPCLEWLAEWAGMVGFDDLAHALETAAKPDDIEAAVRGLLECLATLAGDERRARRLFPRDVRRILAALAPPRRGRPRKPKSPKPEGSNHERGRPRGSPNKDKLALDRFLTMSLEFGLRSPAKLAESALVLAPELALGEVASKNPDVEPEDAVLNRIKRLKRKLENSAPERE